MRVFVFVEQGTYNRITERALAYLQELGFHVVFGSVGPVGELHVSLAAIGIECLSYDARTARDYPRVVFSLARYFRQNDFDIIHSAEAIPSAIAGLAGMMASQSGRIFHRQHVRHEPPSAWKQNLFTWIGNRTNQIVMACSEASRGAAIDHDNVEASRVVVAYNGSGAIREVNAEEVRELRRSLGISDSDFHIVILSKLRKVKGHPTLFESLPLVAEKLKNALHLTIVGSGPDEMLFRAMAEKASGHAEIHFVGHQDDVALWFRSADVVAMPSYIEAFGYAAVEAMACGRPIIASRVGGLPEIISHGVDGVLVEPADPVLLAEHLVRVLSDKDLAERLGKNGAITATSKFSIEAMVTGWISCYKRCLAIQKK